MAAGANQPGSASDQWPLWEVFTQAKDGAPHEHAGSVHAPDAELARLHAAGVRGVRINVSPVQPHDAGIAAKLVPRPMT